MARHFFYSLLIVCVALLSSCKEVVSNEANNSKMKDSLFKKYPNVNRVSIDIQENENVIIMLGDKEFYNGSDEKRKQVAEEVGLVTLHIYEENNWLKKGKLVFVPAESQVEVEESLKKPYNMNLQSLREKVGK